MPLHTFLLRRSRAVLPALGALLAVASAAPVLAQSTGTPEDSIFAHAREKQKAFELFRQSRIPVVRPDAVVDCDQQIGRMCIWFGGEGESLFPPEPPETEQARRGLIAVLIETDRHLDEAWVTGMLIHYLVEQGDPRMAERLATECDISEAWWCAALLGYSKHVRGAFVEAESHFREALDLMPAEERARWLRPGYVVPSDVLTAFDALSPDEKWARFERLWKLSDPLFLVPGNDRLTDHFARLVQLRNFEDAGNPQGIYWDDDLAETLVRYGRTRGWSRTHNPRFPTPGANFDVQDTRRMIGHHHPNSRGYLFPGEFLEAPADIPPESWITAPRRARTWYAPPYAPDFRALESQVGRFRRGDEMLVVGAYRPDQRSDPGGGDVATWPGAGRMPSFDGPVESALFLMTEQGDEVVRAESDDATGVYTLRAPPGRYVSSLEVFDPEGERAWRARQGVRQDPLVPGLVAVSDLMLLDRGAPFPASLDEAIPHVRPGVRVTKGEAFTIIWEVYGLRVEEPVRVTVGFTEGRPGFLARVGEFLGIIETDEPVEVTFTDEAVGGVQSAFRALSVDIPEDLEPGAYTLHLRLELSGREPVIASRPIVVEE